MKSLSLRSGLLAVLGSGLAMANSATFVTPAGSMSGGPVNAQADFTTGAGIVTIDLTNLLSAAQVNDVAQNLSDLFFTLSGTFATGLVSDANRTYSGKLIDIAGGGAVTTDGGNGNPASYNRWFFSNTGSTFHLDDLGGGAPAQTIIGGTTSTTTYPGANGSIAGNGPHNPFLQGTAHFVLTIPGVTAATNITAATFSFGTVPGVNIPGHAVPEPRLVSFLFIGCFFFSVAFHRQKRYFL